MSARLLKVLVQPVYVVEQDGELVEVPVQPIAMSAVQWRALDPQTWAKEGATQVDAQLAPIEDVSA